MFRTELVRRIRNNRYFTPLSSPRPVVAEATPDPPTTCPLEEPRQPSAPTHNRPAYDSLLGVPAENAFERSQGEVDEEKCREQREGEEAADALPVRLLVGADEEEVRELFSR